MILLLHNFCNSPSERLCALKLNIAIQKNVISRKMGWWKSALERLTCILPVPLLIFPVMGALSTKRMRGSTMQGVLLVLGLLSLMTPLACAQDQPYQDVVNRFIQEYNTKSESESLFRLSVLTLPPQESNDPTAPQLLQFTIRETVCSKTEHRNPEECNFKENGLVEECIGTVDLYSSNPSVDISCDEPEKVKRGIGKWIKDRVKELGNIFRKILPNRNVG
ncbi:antibacterial peptide PMAP-36-like [Notamacropus eugenii]|uniref:antibacterial peptide PMAP-36-like n=1 Tax=Notamacropus eugenii TaxID=9315 RepID=UPI003B66B208